MLMLASIVTDAQINPIKRQQKAKTEQKQKKEKPRKQGNYQRSHSQSAQKKSSRGTRLHPKVRWIYDTLKDGGGDVGTEQEFNNWFFESGAEGEIHRKYVYEAFAADRDDVGSSYEEFCSWLGLEPEVYDKPIINMKEIRDKLENDQYLVFLDRNGMIEGFNKSTRKYFIIHTGYIEAATGISFDDKNNILINIDSGSITYDLQLHYSNYSGQYLDD